jgi:Aspartyl protease
MMQYAAAGFAFALVRASCPVPARSGEHEATIASADRLFEAGEFVQARKQFARIADQPTNYPAILHLGRIALLSNQLDEAKSWFGKAIALRPDEIDPRIMLAEVLYRRDEFANAAKMLSGIDLSASQLVIAQCPTLNVAKLQSFNGQTPYELRGTGQSVHVKFLRTDPLPLVSVRVNGGHEVTFFLDTGGSEVMLDSEFARELGVPNFGSLQGTFSGGQQTKVQQGRIDSLTLGNWTVQNLPVAMLPLRQLSAGLDAKQIDGILGTTLFYHFLTTLDFRHGELVLRRKDMRSEQQVSVRPTKGVAVPFWIAGDHFMVSWGRVESLPPSLLFVDTGLAGAGVKLAESGIKQAGITLERDKATAGAGAGGTLTTVPYVVHRLSFGKLQEENVSGLFDGPFPWKNTFGFHLAGMVGHDFFRPYAVTLDFTKMEIVLK